MASWYHDWLINNQFCCIMFFQIWFTANLNVFFIAILKSAWHVWLLYSCRYIASLSFSLYISPPLHTRLLFLFSSWSSFPNHPFLPPYHHPLNMSFNFSFILLPPPLPPGTLWNLSSYEPLKMVIINHGLQTLTNEVIIPHSGWEHEPNEDSKPRDAEWTTVFKNTSGCLR